jgi:S1-C subfamily serine protease
MRNLFRILGNIFNAVWPYAYTFILFFILFGVEARTALEVKELKAQEEQNATDTATYYDAVLQLDMALAQADVQIAKNLDKIKADEAKQNDAIIRTIYAVDKKADARADAIVYGVNKVVDGVNYALQKPSYNYLKNITVKIIGRAKDYETAPPGKRGWMGTGVIIAVTDKATYILTNRHVMGQYGDGTHDY